MLNHDQNEAVHAPLKKHLLIVAGAGTGKTKALTHRIAHLADSGIPIETICAITFTNKAARELEERVESLFRRLEKKIGFVGTFHSLGARILRKEARHAGRTPDFVIFDDHDSLSIVKKVVARAAIADPQKRRPAQLRSEISRVKSRDPRTTPREALSPPLEEIFENYEKELVRHNAFDFDDLLQKTVGVFVAKPQICAAYRQQFAHILVDEYQDVNTIQHALLAFLVGPEASLSAVGDAEQTIYSFRGSNIRIFLDFPSRWKNPHMVTLTQNYRSTKTILAAASSVISHNRYDTAIARATDLWTENETGEPITLYTAKNDNDEAQWVAKNIEHRTKNNREPRTENREQRSADAEPLIPNSKFQILNSKFRIPDSTAILYRTNAQSRAIEQALIGKNIPYRIFGGVKFYERKEVKDVIAALRLALNGEDTLSRERLEKGITKRRFARYAKTIGNAPRSPRDAITFFLNHTQYFEYLESTFLNASERRENIEELLRFAEEFDSLPLFLERVALLQSTDDRNGSTARAIRENQLLIRENPRHEVQLMTIHIAKGLEFDHVFIVGCTEGILPHARSMREEKELQEERRLMYVAMTRAKKSLAISFYDIPSRFLGEIPKECIVFESGSENRIGEFEDSDYEEQWIEF